MGREIDKDRFTSVDEERFRARLQTETALLQDWFASERFANTGLIAGCEIEACLIDCEGRPAAANQSFLAALDDPLVTDELALFDIELNCPPVPLHGLSFAALEQDISERLRRCRQVAGGLGLDVTMIGILPSLQADGLDLEVATDSNRYRALNARIQHLRGGRPFRFRIDGSHDRLACEHDDIMFEAVATAHQLHLQMPQTDAAACYNAALLIAAPLLAVAANSPFLFGHDLWAETRVPVFKQAVDVGDADDPPRYVSFGSGFLRASLFELFDENQRRFAPLLPEDCGADSAAMAHVSLHNGTIWRWTRPVIGVDGAQPHLRIEHRALPSGPSVIDMVANAALFYGLVLGLVAETQHPLWRLPFRAAGDNFYNAARLGLDAELSWVDGSSSVVDLVRGSLLDLAAAGLRQIDISTAEIDRYLGIIAARVQTGQNGAAWQRAWVARHRDLGDGVWNALTLRYTELQHGGKPVHEWPLDDATC